MDGKAPLTVSDGLLAGHEAIFDALGDRNRRRILDRLRSGPLPVVEIARGLPVSRPAVSQHLKVLKLAGLVVDRPESNRRLYALDPNGLTSLRALLESFLQDGLTRFASLADEPEGGGGHG